MRRAVAIAVAVLGILADPGRAGATPPELFPRPPAVQPRVALWTRVYAEVDTNGGLIHDARDLGIGVRIERHHVLLDELLDHLALDVGIAQRFLAVEDGSAGRRWAKREDGACHEERDAGAHQGDEDSRVDRDIPPGLHAEARGS